MVDLDKISSSSLSTCSASLTENRTQSLQHKACMYAQATEVISISDSEDGLSPAKPLCSPHWVKRAGKPLAGKPTSSKPEPVSAAKVKSEPPLAQQQQQQQQQQQMVKKGRGRPPKALARGNSASNVEQKAGGAVMVKAEKGAAPQAVVQAENGRGRPRKDLGSGGAGGGFDGKQRQQEQRQQEQQRRMRQAAPSSSSDESEMSEEEMSKGEEEESSTDITMGSSSDEGISMEVWW